MRIHPLNSAFYKLATGRSGWRDLDIREQETAHKGKVAMRKSLLNIVHISDTHLCDAQSPARVEYLDRFADPHHPLAALIGSLIGTYRAQEVLTAQVFESMVRAINSIDRTPVTNSEVDLVLITGDLTDNAQINELSWFTTLSQGGAIRPDSGSWSKWEGAGAEFYSPHFWNPHGTPAGEEDDFPRKLYGFPEIPELLDAVRQPFVANGFSHPWLAVHGNHDALLQGTVLPDETLRAMATSNSKIMEISDPEAISALAQVTEIGPARYPLPTTPTEIRVTADSERDFVSPSAWSHSFPNVYSEAEGKYWRKDYEFITILALDTVNPFGGWQGSLDREQFTWLQRQIESLDNRFVVITSHHPLDDLINGYTPELQSRVLRDEVEKYLLSQAHVIAWICGHTHQHRITHFGPDESRGFWQIETASLIDWPQQGRVIEIFLDDNDHVCIGSTVFDHAGEVCNEFGSVRLDDVAHLAGLSRVVSLNDWQRRDGDFKIELNEGIEKDQNVILVKPIPASVQIK
jgi:metallophosphoesterase (TIGR03767 family)